MNILEDIWFGSITPCEVFAEKDSEFSEVLRTVTTNVERLKPELTDKGKMILTALLDMQQELLSIGTKDAFVYGVCYGVRVAAAAFAS